jgi:hypothetical protein
MMATTGIDLARPGLASDSFSVARVIGHYVRVPRQTSAQNPHRGSPSSVTVPHHRSWRKCISSYVVPSPGIPAGVLISNL